MSATTGCGTRYFLGNATPPWLLWHFATKKKIDFCAVFATKMPHWFATY